MTFNLDQFHNFIVQNNIVKFSDTPFTLKSGQQSNVYVNWRIATEDVFSTDQLSDFLLSYLADKNLAADCVIGVPEGATKLGIITSFKMAKHSSDYQSGSHVLAMGRGKPKAHGDIKDSHFIGLPINKKVVVIEDVTTTGTSLREFIGKLKEAGVDVIAAITLTNRHPNKKELNESFDGLCPLYAMSELENIIPLLNQKKAA